MGLPYSCMPLSNGDQLKGMVRSLNQLKKLKEGTFGTVWLLMLILPQFCKDKRNYLKGWNSYFRTLGVQNQRQHGAVSVSFMYFSCEMGM